MAWTEERVETLKKLWTEGLSASQIASRLGDVTRNAVIGKVHRLGLSGRATTSRMKTVRPRKRTARVGAKPGRPLRFGAPRAPFQPGATPPSEQSFELEGELEIPMEERKYITTLTESCCRWPIGDPTSDDFHFCGKQKTSGLPYCEFHARRAFQPAQPRRRQPRREQPVVAKIVNG
ncbi:MAG: GcrA family cell cycle regulator [Pseudomonadota bacterium]